MSYLVATSAHADQIVSGLLPSGNTTWDNISETYLIDTSINGPVDVPAGSTLTIATGVTVKNRNTNKSAITISGGILNATGATFQFETSASTAGGKQPIIVSGAGSATFTLCSFTVADGATSTNMESKVLTATNSSTLTIAGSTFTTGTGQGQPTWYAVWTGNSAVLNITASGATPTSFSGFPISVFSSSSAGVSIANAAIAVKDIGVQLINAGVGVIADSSFTAGSDAVKLYGIENSGAATLTVNTSSFTGLAQGVRVVQAGTVSVTSLTAISNTTGVLITQATGVITISGGTWSNNGTAVQIDANAASTVNNSAAFFGNTYGIVMNSASDLTVTNAALTNNAQGIRALRVGTLSLTGTTIDNTAAASTSIGIYTDVMTAFSASSTTVRRQNIGLRLNHSNYSINATNAGISFSENNRDIFLDGDYVLETITTDRTLLVGRYILDNSAGPITIAAGKTLILAPGTEILNKNQNQNLFHILGVLNATDAVFTLKTASNANSNTGTAVFDFAGGDGAFTRCTFRSSDTVAAVNSRVINLRGDAAVSVVGCDLASTPESGLFKTAKGIVVSETAILSLNSSSGVRTTISGFIHGVYSTSFMDLTVRDTDFMLNDTGLYYSADFDLRLINSTLTLNTWGIALPNVGFLQTQNSSATDNTYALSLTWNTVRQDFSGLAFARNTFDSFLDGTVTLAGNVTMPAMRYRVDLSAGPIVVPAAAQLDIPAGAAFTNNVASSSSQRNDLFDVRGTLNATGATFTINTRRDASSGSSSRGTYGFSFAGSGIGTFTDCVFSASDNNGQANSRIMNLADSAAVTIAGSTLSTLTTSTATAYKTQYGIVINNSAALTITGTAAHSQSTFSGFPIAIQASSLATGITIANTAFTDCEHGILYLGSYTLAANYTLPHTVVSFENPLIVPAGITLTIPSGTTLRNYSERTALDVAGSVTASGAAFEFITNGTQAIILRGSATGTFTNCAFTASDRTSNANSRIFQLLNTASLSLSGCALTSTTARGNKTYFGIVVNDNASLALTAAGATRSTFTGFPRAIEMANSNVSVAGTDFMNNTDGLTFPTAITLAADWTLPVADLTFNQTVTIPAGITLTIPAGSVIRNSTTNYNQIFLVRGRLQATDGVSFIINTYSYYTNNYSYSSTYALQFEGTGTGSFANCTFTATEYYPTSPLGSRIIDIRESAAVTVRDCALQARRSNPNPSYVNTAYGIYVAEQGVLRFETGQGAPSGSSFDGFSKYGVSYSSSQPLSPMADLDFTNCGLGLSIANQSGKAVTIRDSSFSHCGAGVSASSIGTLTLQNLAIDQSATVGLDLSSVTTLVATNVSIANCATAMILANVPFDPSGFALTNNTVDWSIQGGVTLTANASLPANTMFNGSMIVAAGVTLTIPAGSVIRNAAYNQIFLVRGSLQATAGASFIINTATNYVTYALQFEGTGTGSFANCTFTATEFYASPSGGSDRIIHIRESAAVTVRDCAFRGQKSNPNYAYPGYGIYVVDQGVLRFETGSGAVSGSSFDGFASSGIAYESNQPISPIADLDFTNCATAGLRIFNQSGKTVTIRDSSFSHCGAGIFAGNGAIAGSIGTLILQNLAVNQCGTGILAVSIGTATLQNLAVDHCATGISAGSIGTLTLGNVAIDQCTTYGLNLSDVTVLAATNVSVANSATAMTLVNVPFDPSGFALTNNTVDWTIQGGVTLTTNASLPANVTFNGSLTVAAGVTLTIPAGRVIRNPGETQVFLVRGHLQATAGASFIVANKGTTALQFEGTGTGSFANCIFTAFNSWPYQTSNRVMHIRESAAVTIRDCIFQGRTDNPNVANTPYGISVVDQGVLRFETGSGSPSGTSFDGFSTYGVSYGSNQPLSPIADLHFTNCNIGLYIFNQSGKTVTIRDSSFSRCVRGVEASGIGTLTLQDVTINQCGTGIQASSIGALTLEDVAIDQCTTAGLVLGSVTALATTNVTIANCATAMQLTSSGIDPSGIVLTNNTLDWSIVGGVTLTANASLPANTIFYSDMTVAAGVTLTIPAGCVISNSTSYGALNFLVYGHLEATSSSFVTNTSGGSYALHFGEAGTGSFANCTFTATEYSQGSSNGSRIIRVSGSAAVTIRDCAFQGLEGDPRYANTGYGIAVTEHGVLRFETGSGAASGSSFDGFSAAGVNYSSDKPLLVDHVTFTHCAIGILTQGVATLTLQNLVIDQCSSAGLDLSSTTALTTTNVTITNCAAAMRLSSLAFNPSGIALANNTVDWSIQGGVTLTTNANLPANTLFNGSMIVAEGVTLTIPAGRVIRNSTTSAHQLQLRLFQVRGHLEATAGASFVMSTNATFGPTYVLRFEGTGTGAFANCTFTATDFTAMTIPSGSGIFHIGDSASVTVRDCVFEARRSNPNYVNTSYGIVIANNGALAIDEGQDECTFTGFRQAAIYFENGNFTPGPLRFSDNTADILLSGGLYMVGDVTMPERLVFGNSSARIGVPEGSTLTIPAGFVFTALPSQNPLLILGELIASDATFNVKPGGYAFDFRSHGVGTFGHCRFNSTSGSPSQWIMNVADNTDLSMTDCSVVTSNSSLDFKGNATGTLVNCSFGASDSSSSSTQRVVNLADNAIVTVDQCKIGNVNENASKIGYALAAANSSKLSVTGSIISGFLWGIHFNGASPFVLTDSVLAQCGIGLQIAKVPANYAIRNNDFFNSTDYAVFNNTTTVVDCRDNYWGHSTGPRHPTSPGGLGDRVSNYVLFEPFHTDTDGLTQIEVGNHGVGQTGNAFGTPGNHTNALLARFSLALDGEPVHRIRLGFEPSAALITLKLINARLVRDANGNGLYDPATDGAPVAGVIDFTAKSITFETTITGDGAFLVLADAVGLGSQDAAALTLTAAGVTADPGTMVVGGMTSALHYVDRLYFSETRGVRESDNLGSAADQAKVELLSFFLTPGYTINSLTFRLSDLSGIDAANFTRAELAIDANADGAVDTDETVLGGGQVTTSGSTGTIRFTFTGPVATGNSYILHANLVGLMKDDRLTVGLALPDIGAQAGVAISGSVASVTHKVEIPLLILDTAFMRHNQFVPAASLEDVVLLAFTFIPSGRRIDGLTFRLTEVQGIRAADVANVRLIWDLNRNGVANAGEIGAGGPGAVSIDTETMTGSITFSQPFVIQGEYIMLADVANLEYDDTFTIGIAGEDVRVGPRDVVEGGVSPITHDVVRPEREQSGLNQNWTLNYRSPGGISAYGAYSHAGDRVIIGYSSGTAYIYDVASNTPQVMLHKHYDRIQYAGFSADDSKVITVTRDGAIYIWNVATAELEKNLFSDILIRYAVASPDMSKLFIVTEGRGLLLDLNTGQRPWELVIGTQLNSADYSTDGSLIVVGADDKRTYLVDATNGVVIRAFQGHSQVVTGATFAANGTRMLSNSPDATATLWKVTDNVTPIATVSLANHSGVGATVNSQGTRIAMLTLSFGNGYTGPIYYLRLFNEDALEIWTRQLSATEFTGTLGSFEFDDAGGRILLTSNGNISRAAHFRVTDGAFLGSWGPRDPLSGSYNHRVRISNDGNQIFFMNSSGLDLINRDMNKTISTILTSDRSYDITPDGKKVLVQNGQNIELYSLEDGRFTLITSNTVGPHDAMTLSESGGLVITGDRIYRTRTGELYVNTPNVDSGYPSAFSPDESLWGIAFSGDQSIKTQLTSDTTGKLEYPVTLTAPYRPFKIFYHPDGIRVGCVDSSAGVQMYRLDNNDPVGLYDYRTSGPGIRDAELSKDGTMLLIASGNNVKLFDMKTGQVLRYFYPQHSDQGSDNVQSVSFGRDDRTIMIAWTHNYVELYDRAKLTRLEISPTARTLDVGESQRFVVRAVYDDGSQINVSPRYKRRNRANADFNPGENAIEFAPGAVLLADPPDGVTIEENEVTVNADANGEILLTAVYTEAGLTRSATATITVGQAQLTALDATPEQVTLSKGVVIPISYIATFSDGYSEDVSDRVAMTADRPDRVRIVPPNVSINLSALPGDIQVTGQFTFRGATLAALTTISNHGARSEWERTVVTPGGDGLGLEFSPNGTRMATGSGSGAITIYRVGLTPTQYTIDQTFVAHERPVRFLTYLSNTELLTAGEDGRIRKWNLADTSAPVQEYLHDAVITGVAYNNGALAFGDNTGRVMLLNLATNSLRWSKLIHLIEEEGRILRKAVTTVAMDGDSVLSGGDDEAAWLSRRSDGVKIFKYTGFSEPLVNVGYMGSMTYAAAGDNRMQVWNKATEDENLREYYYPATPTNVNYLNAGGANYLYVSTVFLTNATWVYNSDGLLLRWYEHPPAEGNIRSLRVTPNGEHLVTGRSTGTVIREKISDGKKVLVPEISAFHSYQFWNVARGNFNGELNHSFSLTDAKVNAAGTRLYTQCSKRTFAWDLSGGSATVADKLLETGYFVPFSFNGIQLTADDPGHLATRVGDSIFILDTNQRLLKKTVNTTTTDFAISPNGTRLMTNGNCSGSNCVRFWDISLIFPTVVYENERLSATTAMAFIDNDDSVGTIPGDGFIARYNSEGQLFSGINFEQLAGQELAGASPEEIVVNGGRMGVAAAKRSAESVSYWVQVYDIRDRLEAALVRSEFLGEFAGEGAPSAPAIALSNDGNLLFWGFEKKPVDTKAVNALEALGEIEKPLGEDAAAGHLIDISTGQLLNIFLPPSMGTIYNQGVAAAQFTRNDGALMIAWKEGYAAIYERQGLTSIQVSPVARTLPPASSVTIATRAIFADGSIQDVTAAATLSTATPTLVTINGNVVTVSAASALGTQIVITSTYHELGVTRTANVTLTVGQPTFLNMTVDPVRLSVNAGAAIQYHFIGEFQGTGVQDITGFTTITAVPADRVTINGNTVQVKANAQFGELLITGISVRNGEERSATAVLQIRNPFDVSDRGDFDGDRDVDFNDLVYFVGQYGETSASVSWDSRTDLDADHDVDFNDLTAFVGLYGTHYTARSASTAAREESGVPFQGASEEREELAAGEEETDGRTLKGYATLAAREAGPLVRVTLEGPPAPVRIGDVFELRVKIQEFSAQASGFRGGPLDIQFDGATVDYAGAFDRHEIIQPPFNSIITNGHLRSGLIDELGGVTVTDGLGENEPVLYAILKFTATKSGVAEFTVAAGDAGLALTPPVGQVAVADISYGSPLRVEVAGANHPPVAHNLNFWAPTDAVSVFGLQGSDPDGDPITLVLPALGAAGYPVHGVLSEAEGQDESTALSVRYDPETGYAGDDSFHYRVTDGTTVSEPAVVHIAVGLFENSIHVERGDQPFITLVFGVKPDATEAFVRSEGDHLAPPAGFHGEAAYFALATSERLSNDIRGLGDERTWKLVLESQNSSGGPWTLSWADQPLLPRGIQAMLTPTDALWSPNGASVDMTQQSSLIADADAPGAAVFRYLLTLAQNHAISYQLTADWNLIGVPFAPDEESQDAFFDDDHIWSIWGWHPLEGYVMPEFLRARFGYWVFADVAHPAQLTGTPAPDGGVILHRGWNLASPSEPVLSPESLSAVSSCWGWSLADGYFRVSADAPEGDLCLPGVGYWIYATKDGVVIWE